MTRNERDAKLRAVDELASRLRLAERSAALDSAPGFPRAEFREMARAGLVGLRLPRRLGGAGLGMSDAGAVLRRLAYRSGTTFAKLSLQPEFCSVLAERGSAKLRARYFAPLIRGEALVANQITEPDAGSDVAGVSMRAEPVPGGYRLSGTKTEAAFAVDAGAAIVYARVPGPSQGGITAFVVPQDLPGIRREVIGDLGERWMRRGSVVYDSVQVPADHRIGDEGRALEYLKDELSRERALLASIYLGVARASWEDVVRHVARRTAFGRPLSDQQAVAFPLVSDGARLRAAELFVDDLLRRMDGSPDSAAGHAAVGKWLAVDVALQVLDHAIQFHGGRGYSKALPHEQRWRDVRSGAIAHGPSEIMLRIAARQLWPRVAEKPGSEKPIRHAARSRASTRPR